MMFLILPSYFEQHSLLCSVTAAPSSNKKSEQQHNKFIPQLNTHHAASCNPLWFRKPWGGFWLLAKKEKEHIHITCYPGGLRAWLWMHHAQTDVCRQRCPNNTRRWSEGKHFECSRLSSPVYSSIWMQADLLPIFTSRSESHGGCTEIKTLRSHSETVSDFCCHVFATL